MSNEDSEDQSIHNCADAIKNMGSGFCPFSSDTAKVGSEQQKLLECERQYWTETV